jgi:hypothetical protein
MCKIVQHAAREREYTVRLDVGRIPVPIVHRSRRLRKRHEGAEESERPPRVPHLWYEVTDARHREGRDLKICDVLWKASFIGP